MIKLPFFLHGKRSRIYGTCISRVLGVLAISIYILYILNFWLQFGMISEVNDQVVNFISADTFVKENGPVETYDMYSRRTLALERNSIEFLNMDKNL